MPLNVSLSISIAFQITSIGSTSHRGIEPTRRHFNRGFEPDQENGQLGDGKFAQREEAKTWRHIEPFLN